MAKRKAATAPDNVSSMNKYFLLRFGSVKDYLLRIGAEPRSMRTAVVKETIGTYYKDKAVIRFEKTGIVNAPDPYKPTENEAARIVAEMAATVWPEMLKIKSMRNPHPKFLRTPDQHMFYFYDEEGFIIMIQRRYEDDKGKGYISYTYWNDEQWHEEEPEGPLPLWGTDRFNNHKVAVIHEGAKAARHIADLIKDKKIDDHPWGDELKDALHLGWIGGAQNPMRTDWSFLKKKDIKLAYIICDNDEAGINALQPISKAINIPCLAVRFDDRFKAGFDLADPFPDELFKSLNGIRWYAGYSMNGRGKPFTWLTDTYELNAGKRGRPGTGYKLRDHASHDIFYISDIDRFMLRDTKNVQHHSEHFNRVLANRCDTLDISKLVIKEDKKFTARITYEPGQPHIFVRDKETFFNTYEETPIRPVAGPVDPFLEFIHYLIPDEEEAREVIRWCATLIGRPDLRMRYAMLLISEKTGVGKTTLVSAILKPLVGSSNYSSVNERRIGSEFNEWVGGKRLAYIAEIYQGHDFKVTNALKDAISDDDVTINEKHKAPYNAENRVHIIASSNSMNALKLDLEDRRWYIPEVTEARWPDKKFKELHSWLERGGLSFIHQWAIDFEDHVETHEHSPMTKRKREVIDEGKSEYMMLAEALLQAMVDSDKPLATTDTDVYALITAAQWQRKFGRVYEKPRDVKKAALNLGLKIVKAGTADQGRLRVRSKNGNVLVNLAGYKMMSKEKDVRGAFAKVDAYDSDVFKAVLQGDL